MAPHWVEEQVCQHTLPEGATALQLWFPETPYPPPPAKGRGSGAMLGYKEMSELALVSGRGGGGGGKGGRCRRIGFLEMHM